MANEEQVEILCQGVAAWNQWREEHPDAKINLRGANLNGRDLSGANFRNADIRGARFRNAALIKADFTQAKAGHTLAGLCRQDILALIVGSMLGWTMSFAITLSVAVFSALFPQISFFVLSGVSCVFTGGMILGVRKGGVATIAAIVLIITAIVFAVGAAVGVAFTLVAGAVAGAAAGAALALAAALAAGAALALAAGAALALAAGAALALAAGAALALAALVVLSTGAAGAPAAVTTIINLIIISAYIGWRARREDPQFALLRRWGLVTATWFGTDFRGADLTDAVFDNARLQYTRFVNATLTGVSWQQAQKLQFARFSGAILDDRDVRELLAHGNGQGRSFRAKNLHGAYLVETDLRNADLREAELIQANLSRASLTGAKLYGSARENWIIDDIGCDYVYWDEAGNERTPPDRDFRPGEFEELYKQLPTFEYIFEHGLTAVDTVVMARVVEMINRQNPEFKLELVNFDKRGQPHATFTVLHKEDVEAAKQQVKEKYDARFAQMEGHISRMQRMLNQLADRPQYIINQLQGAIDMGDTINIHGGQIGAVGTGAIATGNTFQQIAGDLSRLRDTMQANARTPEQQAAAEDIAKAEQAAQQQDEPTMRQHLKSAGQWALDCAKDIGTDVAAEYLKKVTFGL